MKYLIYNQYNDILDENVWRRFHRDQTRRERLRMIRRRAITPAHSMAPQLLVRNDRANGGWSPYIGESR